MDIDSTVSSHREEYRLVDSKEVKYLKGSFWTSSQRKGNSIHQISYRACFKPQLPEFFIKRYTGVNQVVYDPFMGRGTTPIEAILNRRYAIGNDINRLSLIMTKPRLNPPRLQDVIDRLHKIPFDYSLESEIDLSMFYHRKTLAEILSLREYFRTKELQDNVDNWIRMIATNRLTGHSRGFFSVYTLPPNQAVSPERQVIINKKRNQTPEYRDVKGIIIRKSSQLLRDIDCETRKIVSIYGSSSRLLNVDARYTKDYIQDESVDLTVTSPPFLNVVNYVRDNWLRLWFNDIDPEEQAKMIFITNSLERWSNFILSVLKELYRITKNKGYVAFEVGEVNKRQLPLDEVIVSLGVKAGFDIDSVYINLQSFTKTSHIWGIRNNESGTNTNRIVLLKKDK